MTLATLTARRQQARHAASLREAPQLHEARAILSEALAKFQALGPLDHDVAGFREAVIDLLADCDFHIERTGYEADVDAYEARGDWERSE